MLTLMYSSYESSSETILKVFTTIDRAIGEEKLLIDLYSDLSQKLSKQRFDEIEKIRKFLNVKEIDIHSQKSASIHDEFKKLFDNIVDEFFSIIGEDYRKTISDEVIRYGDSYSVSFEIVQIE